jgi:hypothetical protein
VPRDCSSNCWSLWRIIDAARCTCSVESTIRGPFPRWVCFEPRCWIIKKLSFSTAETGILRPWVCLSPCWRAVAAATRLWSVAR